jgi:hypothetical protein
MCRGLQLCEWVLVGNTCSCARRRRKTCSVSLNLKCCDREITRHVTPTLLTRRQRDYDCATTLLSQHDDDSSNHHTTTSMMTRTMTVNHCFFIFIFSFHLVDDNHHDRAFKTRRAHRGSSSTTRTWMLLRSWNRSIERPQKDTVIAGLTFYIH